jgi:hypothetical protein
MQKKKCEKTPHFLQKHVYDTVGSLPVMPSLLPYGLWGRSQVSLIFARVVSPALGVCRKAAGILLLHLKCVFANILLISFIFNIKFMFCICFIIIIDLIFIDFRFYSYLPWNLSMASKVSEGEVKSPSF